MLMQTQAIYLSILNIGGRALNFLLFWLIANKFGASLDTDWFFFVYSIVYLIVGIFVQSVESVLVPHFHCIDERLIANHLRSTFIIGLYATLLVVAISLISGLWVAPRLGFSIPGNWQLAVFICISLGIQPLFALLASFLSSWLQFKQSFSLPTIHLSLRAIGIVPFLLLPSCNTILCLSLAFLAGEIFRLLILGANTQEILSPISQSKKYRLGDSFPAVTKEIAWMSFALTVSFINIAVDLAMVGEMGSGSATLVDYAGRLRGFPVLLFGGIMTMLLGKWSHQHLQQKQDLQFKQVKQVFLIVVVCAAIIVGGLVLFVDSIISLVFFSEKFTSCNLEDLKKLLFWYLTGVPMLAGYFILSKAFLVLREIKILAKISLILCGLNYLFNLLFLELVGLKGVAISTSLLDITACFLAFFVLRKKMLASNKKKAFN